MLCLYPGSFDPPTVGHEDIARRAAALFGSVVVCVLENDEKRALFSAEERVDMLRRVFDGHEGIRVTRSSGLTADVARDLGAACLVRGVRDEADYAPEARLAAANRRYAGIDTVLLCGAPEHMFVSSSVVREIMRRGGRLTGFVPDAIVERLQAYRFI